MDYFDALLEYKHPNIPDYESLGIELIKFLSCNPEDPLRYKKCCLVAEKLGFHVDFYPHHDMLYSKGLDDLRSKLKKWSTLDRKLYWKYLDIIGECISTLLI